MSQAIIKNQKFMSYFNDLVSDDPAVRNLASENILQTINKEADSVSYRNYTLKRLLRGLSSPRESARLGFATTFTIFLHVYPFDDGASLLELVDENNQVSKAMISNHDFLYG